MFLAASCAVNTAVLCVSFVDLFQPPNFPPSVTLGRVGRNGPGQHGCCALTVAPCLACILSGASIICTQLSPQPVPGASRRRPITNQAGFGPGQAVESSHASIPHRSAACCLVLVLWLGNQSFNSDPLSRPSYLWSVKSASGFCFFFFPLLMRWNCITMLWKWGERHGDAKTGGRRVRKTSSQRRREKFHLEEVCSHRWASAPDGKRREMINEIARVWFNLHSQVPDLSHRLLLPWKPHFKEAFEFILLGFSPFFALMNTPREVKYLLGRSEGVTCAYK